MALGTAGLSFAPPTSPDPREQRSTSAALGPTQRAIQVLSLHLPRILGSRAISPRSLLAPGEDGGGGGGASPESAVLQSAIRALQGRSAGAASGGPLGQGGDLSELLRRLIASASLASPGAAGPSPEAELAGQASGFARQAPTPSITPGILAPADPVTEPGPAPEVPPSPVSLPLRRPERRF